MLCVGACVLWFVCVFFSWKFGEGGCFSGGGVCVSRKNTTALLKPKMRFFDLVVTTGGEMSSEGSICRM